VGLEQVFAEVLAGELTALRWRAET
jgi:hypothetical protein